MIHVKIIIDRERREGKQLLKTSFREHVEK